MDIDTLMYACKDEKIQVFPFVCQLSKAKTTDVCYASYPKVYTGVSQSNPNRRNHKKATIVTQDTHHHIDRNNDLQHQQEEMVTPRPVQRVSNSVPQGSTPRRTREDRTNRNYHSDIVRSEDSFQRKTLALPAHLNSPKPKTRNR